MDLESTLYSVPGVLLGLTVHEYCHALSAWKLGDSTARDQGRLTLNPIKHIDIIGFLFIVIAGFGWAKPVQFNPENLRRPRLDKAIIAAAGPLSNLVLGVLLVLALKGLIFLFAQSVVAVENFHHAIINALLYAAVVNFGLFIFNLIPIPPLDGSHIVFSGLNLSPEAEHRIMRIGTPLLFIVLIIQNSTGVTIIPISKAVMALLRLFL